MQEAKNLAIWVNGAHRPYGWDASATYKEVIASKLIPQRRKADELKTTIERHTIKTVKGRKYWYAWLDGRWVSKGSAEKGDPRADLKDELERMLKDIKAAEDRMLSAVVKIHGSHVVIDVGLYKKHIGARLPSSAILLSELLNGRKA